MKKKGEIRFYKDLRGEWRWRFVAANGRILADSGEGYASKYNARRAWKCLVTLGWTLRWTANE